MKSTDGIFYDDLLRSLNISPDNPNPSFNPSRWNDVEKAKNRLRIFIRKEQEIEEIIGLAMIGEFGILQCLYPL